MTKKVKTTVDFSDLKERIRRTKKLMADEKVGEHIADAIVDNIRNNSISPKTGKKYRRLTKSTINIESLKERRVKGQRLTFV